MSNKDKINIFGWTIHLNSNSCFTVVGPCLFGLKRPNRTKSDKKNNFTVNGGMLNAHPRLYQWQTDKESTVISINGPLSLNGIKDSWTSFIWVSEFCPNLNTLPCLNTNTLQFNPILSWYHTVWWLTQLAELLWQWDMGIKKVYWSTSSTRHTVFSVHVYRCFLICCNINL